MWVVAETNGGREVQLSSEMIDRCSAIDRPQREHTTRKRAVLTDDLGERNCVPAGVVPVHFPYKLEGPM